MSAHGTDLDTAIAQITPRYEYKADGPVATWRILRGERLRGDCEDYVLTVMHRRYGGFMPMLSAILRREARVWTGEARSGGRHAMGEISGMFFDNNCHPSSRRVEFEATTGNALRRPYSPAYVCWRLSGWYGLGAMAAGLGTIGWLLLGG